MKSGKVLKKRDFTPESGSVDTYVTVLQKYRCLVANYGKVHVRIRRRPTRPDHVDVFKPCPQNKDLAVVALDGHAATR